MASSSKSCVKSRPLRSPVWDYFEISGNKRFAASCACHLPLKFDTVIIIVPYYYIDQLFGIQSLRKPLFE